MMIKVSIAAILITLTGFSTSVLAENNFGYMCRYQMDIRLIDVQYKQRDAKLPCEVKYTKEGQQQSLWRANNEEGYCERKAEGLADTLRKAGWACSTVIRESM